jgi:hypothetical protein
MAEQPPLNRSYVISYAANDRDFPTIGLRADPRVAGYRVPEDLSPHPDSKRYPNHVFTGSQPSNGDERVTHVYEILPAPYVPFTRYDDDLGPIQGRRRSVKNEGQQTSLTADKRVTYEAREGSAIVYTEIEEAWSIETDDDGNSLFPIRDRDFYDASRGAVQERRQLLVPTGEEEGTLENVNGVITQISYEPYNEFLSVKITQTYKVDGPLLIGRATDEARQLATVTTQRKGADGYIPPSPTATKTVEVSREDAESLIERVVEVPEVFGAETYRKTREDITPQKFKAAQEDEVFEQTVEGIVDPNIVLGAGEFVKSEEQINKFTKRVATTSRSITSAVTLSEKVLTPQGQIGARLLRLQFGDQNFDSELLQAGRLIDGSVEALGDERTILSQTVVPSVFSGKTIQKTRTDLTPEKFKAKQEDTTTEETIAGTINPAITLGVGEFRKSEEQVTEFVKRISTTNRDTSATETLSESLITAQGQIATRTLNLVTVNPDNPPFLTPDEKTIDASIEALGDGRVVITNTRVGELFDGKSLSASKPDVIPEQFRASVPAETTEETIAQTSVSMPSLDPNDLEKSEQRVSEFTVRKSTTTRDNGTLPTLKGQEYEPSVNIVIPYDESVVPSGTKLGNAATSIDPLSDDFDLVREFDLDAIESELNSVSFEFPSRTSLSLPPILKSVSVVWSDAAENGSYVSTGSSILVAGSDGRSISESGSASASSSVRPDFKIDMEQIYANNIPTTSYIFFLKYPVTLNNITSKISQIANKPINIWPVFKPQSHTLVAKGQSKSAKVNASASFSTSKVREINGGAGGGGGATIYANSKSSGSGTSGEVQNIAAIATIPPCLHGSINISDSGNKTATGTANITFTWNVDSGLSIPPRTGIAASTGTTPSGLAATNPPNVPRSGLYLIDSRVELYQYGFARIYAEVLDAAQLA